MLTGEMFTTAGYIQNILIEIVARRRKRWKEIGRACEQCKVTYRKRDKSILRWQFLANCTTSTILVGLSSLWLLLVSCLGISKTASKNSKSALQMNFFRESEKFSTKSALTQWKQFSGSECINRLKSPIWPNILTVIHPIRNLGCINFDRLTFSQAESAGQSGKSLSFRHSKSSLFVQKPIGSKNKTGVKKLHRRDSIPLPSWNKAIRKVRGWKHFVGGVRGYWTNIFTPWRSQENGPLFEKGSEALNLRMFSEKLNIRFRVSFITNRVGHFHSDLKNRNPSARWG
jgi:hypothetical protein